MVDLTEAVRCSGVVKIYESASGPVHAVRGVDLAIPRGATVAIVGPSGSGKSTLLRMVSGYSTPSAGSIRINGVDLFALGRRRRQRQRAALLLHVEQRPSDNLLPHLTALQQVRRSAPRRLSDTSAAESVLDSLGLSDRLQHVPSQMSGGEQQRLAFAVAAVARPALLVADEPTAELDSHSTTALLDSLGALTDRGISVLLATHDPRVLHRVDEIVELRNGTISAVRQDGRELSTIDGSGRIQLPPEIRGRFRTDRVALEWIPQAGHLEVREP